MHDRFDLGCVIHQRVRKLVVERVRVLEWQEAYRCEHARAFLDAGDEYAEHEGLRL